MGVPCITLRGKCHAQNVGVSLLTTVGLTDWIADDEDHYIRLAQEKAADLSALSSLRSNMRSKMRASRLMDGRGFVFDLEGVYRTLFRRYCSEGPRHREGAKSTQVSGKRRAMFPQCLLNVP
jgi:predicted O-linked N-acetylglucosamine transferase (SPINDLY family)